MSDYDALTASDTTSRPITEDQKLSSNALQAAPYHRVESSPVGTLKANRAFNRQRHGAQSRDDVPEQVLRAFNTWAFKREQPSDPQLMLQLVASAMMLRRAIPMVLYWGKGPRCDIDEHDCKCMDFLGSMAQRIGAIYPPGTEMRLICTDTHARLNGHPEIGISKYFASVEAEAHRRGMECCWLSDLVEKTHAKPEDYSLGDILPEDMLAKLSVSATKWYHGGASAEEGAAIYFHMNMIEKRAVELSFPDAIFLTFNSSKFRILFPKRLPIFYMYSMQRGVSVKPWFLPAEAKVCEATSCTCRASEV